MTVWFKARVEEGSVQSTGGRMGQFEVRVKDDSGNSKYGGRTGQAIGSTGEDRAAESMAMDRCLSASTQQQNKVTLTLLTPEHNL